MIDGFWHHAACGRPVRAARLGAWWAGPGCRPRGCVARLACGGPHACAGPADAGAAGGARMVLHDPYAPVVGGVQGDLAADRVLSGTAGLSFAAADRGGGVYRAWAEVDGRAGAAGGESATTAAVTPSRAATRTSSRRGGRARSRRARPWRWTPRRCPTGRHAVAVHVEDAAGNRTTVLGPVTQDGGQRRAGHGAALRAAARRAVARAPHRCARASRAWLEHRGRRRRGVTVAYGERVRLRGRVTDSRRPAAGGRSRRPRRADPGRPARLDADHRRPHARRRAVHGLHARRPVTAPARGGRPAAHRPRARAADRASPRAPRPRPPARGPPRRARRAPDARPRALAHAARGPHLRQRALRRPARLRGPAASGPGCRARPACRSRPAWRAPVSPRRRGRRTGRRTSR